MDIGNRIYYDELTGKPILQTGEASGSVEPRKEESIKYIDLPYGDTTLENVKEFHIIDGTIVVDSYYEIALTEEERLRQENAELENQLLLAIDSQVGGIL